MAMVATKHGSMSIDCTGSGSSYDEDCANAALIAKAPIAPKLAEALRATNSTIIRAGLCPFKVPLIHDDCECNFHAAAKSVRTALAEWDAQS